MMGVECKSLQIIQTVRELESVLNRDFRMGKTVGFVPTMGFLHEGHLRLIETAKEHDDIVVMSIFVNPAQFGPGEDFESYPRDLENDIMKAEKAGVDILFIPTAQEMYPSDSGIRILPGPQADVLCGSKRPGHFDGVLKVVLKLFNIVDPDRSYFGMKDAQQLALIETFVRDFNLRTQIVRVSTVREEDGLARSSRNVNLNASERLEAPSIYRALLIGAENFDAQKSPQDIEREVVELINSNTSGEIDYVTLLSYPSLTAITKDSKEVILACAVKFTNTRLIDNIIMSTKDGFHVPNDDEQ
ncbi:pantoate--beta-alanine ligase [Sporosarcina oncorhynchi]|uniref:Pantothenate synthetase n=1 Tax=Sporosarcina oncorhynchi TaxID=3056444 RepID=A0ABZ0LBW2_9BACL|nr:pantoate--beta-alanine ligase [Sporosarcina sp. T2O-4]WOV89081.1 pantoate--beta-alanine ligase [Sporosarcina sp. T2O-4]